MVRLTCDPPPTPPPPVGWEEVVEAGRTQVASEERKRAHDIVMKEYRRLKSQPLYNHTIAERQRQLNLLDRIAKRIKG